MGLWIVEVFDACEGGSNLTPFGSKKEAHNLIQFHINANLEDKWERVDMPYEHPTVKEEWETSLLSQGIRLHFFKSN